MLNHAAKSSKVVSAAARSTFNSIVDSIEARATMTPWDTANEHMRDALIQAKAGRNKAQFIKAAKLATGIARNNHPLLVWCCKNWY